MKLSPEEIKQAKEREAKEEKEYYKKENDAILKELGDTTRAMSNEKTKLKLEKTVRFYVGLSKLIATYSLLNRHEIYSAIATMPATFSEHVKDEVIDSTIEFFFRCFLDYKAELVKQYGKDNDTLPDEIALARIIKGKASWNIEDYSAS